MMNRLRLALKISIALGIASWTANAAAAPAVPAQITVIGPEITLGDIFGEQGPAATTVVGSSPLPGERSVLTVAAIATAARQAGYAWENPNDFVRVTIVRTGKAIPATFVTDGIAAALQQQGNGAKKSIQLRNGQSNLYVPLDVNPDIDVRDVSLDTASGSFVATLLIPADRGERRSITVSGRAFDVVSIPVLNRAMGRDDTIQEADIDWLDVQPNRANSQIVLTAENLIGKSPRRPLLAGAAIRQGDVRDPILVSKGALVKIVVSTPYLLLATTGRALDDGSDGATIRVMNSTSHKTINAVVTSANEVRVDVGSRYTAALSR